MSLVGLGIVIIMGLALGLIGVALVIYFSKDDEDYEDTVFAINFLSKYCQNVAYGIENGVKIGKNGRTIINLSQRDIQGKDISKIKEVPVIVDKNKIITIPKGGWSNDKNIKIYLPPTASDFPDGVKDSEIGKALMWLTEMKNAINDELSMVKEGSVRKSEILKRLGDGELSRRHLTNIDEIEKDLIKLITTGLKAKDSMSSTSKT